MRAWAQPTTAYPSRAVKWIVPFAAGGSGDTIARLLAERMAHALGQPVLIDNRGGNGSVLGTEVAAKANADGYTWVLSNGAAITTGPLMGQATTYRPLEDFVHVTLIGSFTNALIVRQDHPAKNLQEFLALARSQLIGAAERWSALEVLHRDSYAATPTWVDHQMINRTR